MRLREGLGSPKMGQSKLAFKTVNKFSKGPEIILGEIDKGRSVSEK